ncbi:MAG: hypothetical protein ABL901_18485 [Hyphomicrobiaceae bacterium]
MTMAESLLCFHQCRAVSVFQSHEERKLKMIMTDDTAQGIYWELNYVLKPEWTITRQENGFRVGPPNTVDAIENLETELFGEVWRISSFLAYRNFSSIAQTATGYVLESTREHGTGFRIVFDLAPNGLPNHRPKPSMD